MKSIVQDLSRSSLVDAIEQNIFAWIPLMAKLGQIAVDDPPGVTRALVNIPYGLFNSIVNTHLPSGDLSAVIHVITSDAQARHVPIYWWVTPSTQPPGLGDQLVHSGFSLQDDDPGMAVDLAALDEGLEKVSGLVIDQVEDDSSLWQWCQTMALGYDLPTQATFVIDAWHELISKAGPEAIVAYVGRLHGQPVATSLLFLAAGVAGIYAVATIPAARRKGIGAWITLHPLLHARTLGYKAGILEASEMGVGVYRSIGFQEYCRIRSYAYRP